MLFLSWGEENRGEENEENRDSLICVIFVSQ